MTVPRRKLVDPDLTRWYHCMSRCVRQAFLLGEGGLDRKAWIEARLQELSEIFAISVGGFSVLDNHLHVLLRLDPERGKDWTDEEVVRRWLRLYPPRSSSRKPLAVTDELVAEKMCDANWVASRRERLQSLGWLMKCLKEPLARMANKEEKCTGAFFEGRYKSIAILDEEALLSVCAYIDLNPLAAGIAATPEESLYTSVKQRVDNVREQGRQADCSQAEIGSVQASRVASGLEETCWLVPIEDRRDVDSEREGFLAGLTLGNYLTLVDYSARVMRDGKATISDNLAPILERIGGNVDGWLERLRLLTCGKLTGRFFSTNVEKLQAAASHFGSHYLVNLNGCPA